MKKYLPQKEILFFIALYFVAVIFFELFRVMFLLRNYNLAKGVPFFIMIKAFLVGFRFDTAITCYIIAPFYVITNLPMSISFRRKLVPVVSVAIFIIFVFVYFLTLADIEFFQVFNCRLNYYAIGWADTPGFVLKMIWETYPVVRYLLLFTLLMIGFGYLII